MDNVGAISAGKSEKSKIKLSADTANKIRNGYIKFLDLQNAAGKKLVSMFAPACLPIVPKAQKFAKEGRLKPFDFIFKKFVKPDEKDQYGASEEGLSDEELENIEGKVMGVIDEVQEKRGKGR